MVMEELSLIGPLSERGRIALDPQVDSNTLAHLPKSRIKNSSTFCTSLRYVGIVKCDYSVRYSFIDSRGVVFEMSTKDFQKIIPFMVRGVIVGNFKHVRFRGRSGVSYLGA